MLLTTIILAILVVVLACPYILFLLLKPALMCADGGSREPRHVAAGVVAWIADLIAAHTLWYWLVGGLHDGEKTISDSLERLSVIPGPYQEDYIQLSKIINRRSPNGLHIKNVT
jgi:hypothetical protein